MQTRTPHPKGAFEGAHTISEGIGLHGERSTTYEVPIFSIDAFARWHASPRNYNCTAVIINPLKTIMARWVRIRSWEMEVVKEHKFVLSSVSPWIGVSTRNDGIKWIRNEEMIKQYTRSKVQS